MWKYPLFLVGMKRKEGVFEIWKLTPLLSSHQADVISKFSYVEVTHSLRCEFTFSCEWETALFRGNFEA